jgi:molybdopterin synthase catalytic subunit
MANPVCELLFTQPELEKAAAWPESTAGAVVDFRGVVREEEEGRAIMGIDYEAHATMARHQLEVIAREAMERFGLQMALVRHRLGFVPTGEASLLVRVAAAHRREAIHAMEWLVDELKKKVPIWKHPQFSGDGRGKAVSETSNRKISQT